MRAQRGSSVVVKAQAKPAVVSNGDEVMYQVPAVSEGIEELSGIAWRQYGLILLDQDA